ncbi:PKD domain-containing protein, partial [Kaarinaea lacus]
MRNTRNMKVIVLIVSLVALSGCGPASDESAPVNPENPGNTNTGTKPTLNQAPVANIAPDSEQSISVEETIFFSGINSSDPDDNTPLSYRWTFTGAATSMRSSTVAAPGIVSFSEPGTVTATLVVTDNLGLASDPASVVINVYAAGVNRPPNGFISHDNGSGSTGSSSDFTISMGTNVTFQGSAIDPENDPVTYNWDFPANVTIPTAPGSAPFTASFPVAGTYTITLAVSDNAGNVDPTPARVTVTVTDPTVNLSPNGFISHDNGNGTTSSATNINITTDTDVVFQGSAVDPENDPITYTWSIPANVTAPNSPGSQPFTANFPVAGVYTISLTVSDDAGNVDPTPARVTVTVTDPPPVNSPPNGFINHDNGNGTTGSTGNLSIATGTDVVFQGSAVDPDNDPITYTWSIPANVTAPNSPGSQPFTANFPVTGTFTISLTVSDSAGNADPTPAQVTVTVTDAPAPVNLPPNGFISHDNGNGNTGTTGDVTISSGTTVVFNASATDPENDPVTFAWMFNGGTASATTGSGPISVNYTTPGTYVVQLTATDNNGNSDPSPAEITVNVRFPEFQYLPVLTDQDGNPNNGAATYNLTVDSNVDVNVVTPDG